MSDIRKTLFLPPSWTGERDVWRSAVNMKLHIKELKMPPWKIWPSHPWQMVTDYEGVYHKF